ncbi:anaerobic sulfatase maturase, partial [Vibrio parahaemolyticus]|nr:anaerobic sulfatase maturase [Vibrio parahaemolyticus]
KFFTHVDQSLAYNLRATGNPVVHGKYSDQILRQQATQTQTVFEMKF